MNGGHGDRRNLLAYKLKQEGLKKALPPKLLPPGIEIQVSRINQAAQYRVGLSQSVSCLGKLPRPDDCGISGHPRPVPCRR